MSDEIRVLKIGSCPSVSGRSTLTYHIGCKGDKSTYLRISENTGAGHFSKDWIPLTQLDPLLASDEKPITAGLLRSLFKGKSVNSAGFVIAALIAEGLLKVSEGSLRSYVPMDSTEFKKRIQALLEHEEKPAKKETKKPELAANPE
jgi:hypothetical protein